MSTKTCSLRKLTLASAVTLGAGWGAMAQAQETANLAVSADVQASCSINTTALAFDPYDPVVGTAVNNTGSVTVTCTNGAPVAITLGGGLHGTGTATAPARRMVHDTADPQAFLAYSLYSGSAGETVWGYDTTNDVETTGTGAAEEHIVYGTIDGGQSTAQVGAYTDTVVATVNF